MAGFLGIGSAGNVSDLVALVEIALAISLVAGTFLVRAGRVRLHMYLQSSIVLGNLPIVLAWMVPAYLEYVVPGLPGELAAPFYLIPTIMLVVGATAEALGVYILLVAGTDWLPERWRFRRYKLVMRTELLLWWSVVVAGLSTYYWWYVLPGGAS